MGMQQITLNFEAGLADYYGTVRECVAARVHQLGKPQKVIAADMDLSPSDLSRKLSPSPDDHRKFTTDDLERYIESTKDKTPILYYVEKYFSQEDEEQVLQKRLDEIRSRKSLKVAK